MKLKPFTFNMSRSEFIALLIYLPIHSVVLPVLADWHAISYPGMFTMMQYNIAYIAFSFVVVLALALRYLRAEFDTLLDNKILSIFTCFRGYFLYICLSYLILMVALLVVGDIEWANPNDGAVVSLAEENIQKVLCMTVFLAPIVEEVLFRGVVFGSLRNKDRMGAYIVSVLLFAILHVWQYAMVSQDLSVLLYVLDYIPVGIILAWCYESSGSLWVSILFHMSINASSLSLIM